MSVFTKVLRAGEGKKVRRLAELVPMINALEDEMEALDDEALRHKTVEFKERLDQGETLDDLLDRGLRGGPGGRRGGCSASAPSTSS